LNTMKELFKNAVYYGLIMAGVFILIDLIFYVFDLAGMNWGISILVFLVILALYFILFIWAGRSYRDKYMGGYMNYVKAIVFCLIMAGVFVVVLLVYHLVFYYLFDPSRALNEMQKAAQAIQDNVNIPEDRKEEIVNRIMKNATSGKVVVQGIINNVASGVIIGAISALFIRKKEKFTEVF
jgi:glucan phosphoethanolaminetransferase (alkaline phosphatase superfamily)